MDNKEIFTVNKVLYVLMAIALVVVALDLWKWRP